MVPPLRTRTSVPPVMVPFPALVVPDLIPSESAVENPSMALLAPTLLGVAVVVADPTVPGSTVLDDSVTIGHSDPHANLVDYASMWLHVP